MPSIESSSPAASSLSLRPSTSAWQCVGSTSLVRGPRPAQCVDNFVTPLPVLRQCPHHGPVIDEQLARIGEPGRAVVMGVINATPDSFSDGGQFADADAAISFGEQLVRTAPTSST